MIALDVLVDDEPRCRAGVVEPGLVAVRLDWQDPSWRRDPEREPDPPLSLHVTGLRATRFEHVEWVPCESLRVGQEVVVRVLATDVEITPPTRPPRPDPVTVAASILRSALRTLDALPGGQPRDALVAAVRDLLARYAPTADSGVR